MARPDGREIWVNFAFPDNGWVQVIDTVTGKVTDTLQPGTLVCEAVMRDTALLAAARTRGATAHPGHGMLYGQIVEIARSFGLTMAPGNVPRLFG